MVFKFIQRTGKKSNWMKRKNLIHDASEEGLFKKLKASIGNNEANTQEEERCKHCRRACSCEGCDVIATSVIAIMSTDRQSQ